MKIRIFYLNIILVLFFSAALYGEGKKLFRINGEFSFSPVAFSPINSIDGINLSTGWFLGIQNQALSSGIEIVCDYYLFENSPSTGNPAGNRLKAAIILNNLFQLSAFAEMKWGWGGFWLWNTLSTSAETGTNEIAGLIFLNNIRLHFPWVFIWLEIINQLDLSGTYVPTPTFSDYALAYTGIFRINIRPGLKWLNIYLEARGMYWNYSQSNLDMDKAILQFGIGISIETAFKLSPRQVTIEQTPGTRESGNQLDTEREEEPASGIDLNTEIAVENELQEEEPASGIDLNTEIAVENELQEEEPASGIDLNTEIAVENELQEEEPASGIDLNTEIAVENELQEEEPGLKLLREGKKGDIIDYYNILFEIDSSTLVEDSQALLDEIGKILHTRQSLVISLSSYAIYTENPENDLELYLARTKKIIQYLTAQGINPDRMIINPVGYLLISINELSPKLKLEILEN